MPQSLRLHLTYREDISGDEKLISYDISMESAKLQKGAGEEFFSHKNIRKGIYLLRYYECCQKVLQYFSQHQRLNE